MAVKNFVTDYGADPTGATDCWQLLKNALDPNYTTAPGNAVRQTLYFPSGTYLIQPTTFSPLVLPDAGIILTGDGQFGTVNVLIKAGTSVGIKYLFEFDNNASCSGNPPPDSSLKYPRVEIHNIGFQAENILDLRLPNNLCGKGGGGRALIYNCDFMSTSGNKGIAINMLKHDFSIISDCNFYGFYGICAIRMMGWLQKNGAYSDNRSTTQVVVKDCVFSEKSYVGISCELVDSIKITGNDFGLGFTSGQARIGIDIGGNEYWRTIRDVFSSAGDRVNHYFRGEADFTLSTDSSPVGITWDSVTYYFSYANNQAGTGWFSNVNVRDNHFEGFVKGVAVNGSLFLQNHATRIESNNFQNPHANSVMIDLKRALALSTLSNELYCGSITTSKGIQYDDTRSCRFVLDNFYGDDNFNTPDNAYVLVGSTNYNPMIWAGNGGKGFIEASTSARAKFHTDIFAKLPAVGSLVEKTHSIEERISKSATGMNNTTNSTLDLMDLASSSCGIVILYVYNSIGTFCSVWAVGNGDAVVRISNEANTGAVYEMHKTGGKLQYKQIHSQTNVDNYVSGVFIGIQ